MRQPRHENNLVPFKITQSPKGLHFFGAVIPVYPAAGCAMDCYLFTKYPFFLPEFAFNYQQRGSTLVKGKCLLPAFYKAFLTLPLDKLLCFHCKLMLLCFFVCERIQEELESSFDVLGIASAPVIIPLQ